jgi:hypothetical protein
MFSANMPKIARQSKGTQTLVCSETWPDNAGNIQYDVDTFWKFQVDIGSPLNSTIEGYGTSFSLAEQDAHKKYLVKLQSNHAYEHT